jgi:hypothetical protein
MPPTTVLEQSPVPFAGVAYPDLFCQSVPVPGGTLYISILRTPVVDGVELAMAQSFVPAAAGGLVRYLKLTDAKSDLGVPLTGTPGSPAGAPGISRVAGASLLLTGETTSSNAKTDKALFEFDLPDSYVAGAAIPVTVNANYEGAGTVTAANTTIAVAAYTEIDGVEAALPVTAAQQMGASPGDLTFTITGAGLQPGSHLSLELTMLVTSSSGSNTGVVNSVAYQG